MYFIDGGSGALNSLGKFPHTARMLSSHMQPEDCAKIISQLQNEMKTRQQKLAARSVQDITAYRKLPSVEPISDILLTIDDIAEVKKSLEAIKFNNVVETIAYLLKFGPARNLAENC